MARKPKPTEEKKVKLTVGFDPEVAKWLREQRNYNRLLNELVKKEMVEPMTVQFKPGERAKFYTEVAGLSEIMAGFVRYLPSEQRQQAIAGVDNISRFLSLSELKTTTIHHFDSNDYGFSIACELLGKKKGGDLSVGFQELESLWTEITSDWWSQDHWLSLKMALHTRLPKTKRDKEIDTATLKDSEESAKEFRDRLAQEDRDLEARLKEKGL